MIKKFIKKLLRYDEVQKAQIIKEHNIKKQDISSNALTIIKTLQSHGFNAYVVGGAVRDLLLGVKPKDFDVATNATPTEINKLFHKSRIIGKRFQIVLIPFYRGRDQEVIEVTTFRAMLKNDGVMLIKDQTHRKQALHTKVAMDSSGQVWSDNVWGNHDEDASRRDFTINSLYYDPNENIIFDFYNGIKDLEDKILRMIGEPKIRYKEDPARILRIARFAAKTGFKIEAKTLAPIAEHAPLLANIPPARLSDELLKMLMSGYASKCIQSLKEIKSDKYVLPWYEVNNKDSLSFIDLVLKKTDERLMENKSVSSGFIFAAIYWPLVLKSWAEFAANHPHIESLHLAIIHVTAPLQLQRRVIADMQEIWLMQTNLEKRLKSKVQKILEHNKFRACYDFLVLRSVVDNKLKPLADWWTIFQEVDKIQQEQMIKNIKIEKVQVKRKRVRKRKSNAVKAKPKTLE